MRNRPYRIWRVQSNVREDVYKRQLMQSGLFTEIALIDADKNKAEGEAMDISHGIPFASPMRIRCV